ncbi:MAG: U32 family peptidase [Bacilli bacterium]|nr:U32 family peptidase [Bacilli bacterium]
MNKPELLAPAGDMETLILAINSGADAVYVGGESFSARAFAKNFNKKELLEAVKFCHLYDKKLYVAVNTVIFENEIEKCLNYLKYLYEINIDAVIMQDIGMISLTKKLIPNLEIHSSTQLNCHNEECLKLLKKIGVKRAVLAREMSLEEIKKIKTDIDLEIFVHGALCISYSGRCLFSSLNGGRSGNRGKCVGSCRLPYEIYKNNKKLNINYPLSTKELFTANNLEEILKTNIKSLKIEGRMKSKEYVSYVTKVYRRLIDDFYNEKKIKITQEEIINLKKLYNRNFTNGYLFNDDIYNTSSSNHLGTPLGEIIKINKNKLFIKLSDNLHMEDGIRFIKENKGMIVNKIYDEKGLLKKEIKKGNIAQIDNKLNIKNKGKINKTIDRKLLNEINNTPKLKLPINFSLFAHVDKPLKLIISDGKNVIEKESIILSKPINKSTTKKEIIEKLSKINNTPFKINKINIDLENVFIPLSKLNELKHFLINELIENKTKENKPINFKYEKKLVKDKQCMNNYLVKNEKQLLSVKDKADIIYTEDYNLYKKYKKLNIYYRLPNIMKNFPNYENENLLINDFGSLHKYYKNNNIITDYTLNITNSESVKFIQKYNTKLVTLSPEIPDYDILNYTSNTEIIKKGYLELMILKNFYLKSDSIYLKDKLGNKFKIITSNETKIMNSKEINIKENINTNKRIQL